MGCAIPRELGVRVVNRIKAFGVAFGATVVCWLNTEPVCKLVDMDKRCLAVKRQHGTYASSGEHRS